MTQNQLDSRSLKWMKEGRGVGSGKDYKPWLTVRDLSSSGRSHRVWGFQTQRIHHFFSDLELSAFLLFDWNPSVSDIREKYPLRFEDTVEIAKDAGIRHPGFRGKNKVMYTDFLLDLNTPECQRMAIQVQPLSEVYKPRSIEKLEIERRYWKSKNIEWSILIDTNIPKVIVKNIGWLYPAQARLDEYDDTIALVESYCEYFSKHPVLTIAEAGQRLDILYSLPPGESLKNIGSSGK